MTYNIHSYEKKKIHPSIYVTLLKFVTCSYLPMYRCCRYSRIIWSGGETLCNIVATPQIDYINVLMFIIVHILRNRKHYCANGTLVHSKTT